ncbi:unnamed protein product [Chironomus riparius]|uniref:Testicular haploid expressed protein n=1 Tax=Chironomus riparius TaxID=315576 RepID=A0A9N9WWC6_9DIPT|nr:unnamed protein product [Chironomus riparius]
MKAFDDQIKSNSCALETGRRPLNCRKYFGSDHLKYKRQKRFRCKNKRIAALAQPRYYTPKYVPNEDWTWNQNIEIQRDFNLSTRIKMLSVPKVRKLTASYEDYKNTMNYEKLSNISNLMNYSMMTMYSRLANVQLSESRAPRRKWTQKDWQRHCEWLQKRACPKKIPNVKKPPRKIVPLNELETSIHQLSQPRHPVKKYRPTYGYQTAVRNASKQYIPTKRLIKLSEPKAVRGLEEENLLGDELKETFYANPKALTYNATDRIKQLASPKIQFKEKVLKVPPETTIYGVVKRALKASLSERTLNLSKPKIKDNDDDEEEKPAVSPKALKAKATPRILQLAQPRIL